MHLEPEIDLHGRKPAYSIRDYRAADLEQLFRIDQQCFLPGIAYSREELDHYLEHPASFTLVAEDVAEDVPGNVVENGAEAGRVTGGPAATTMVSAESGEEGSKQKRRKPPDVSATSRIAGFIVAQKLKRGTGHIVTIDVLPHARRHRLGSQLMSLAEQRLRHGGSRSVFLEVAVDNDAAIRFYNRHGYSVLKTIPRYYQGKMDALLLAKRLE